MQALVNSALMDATWRSAGGAAADEMLRMQMQCGKDQEQLVAFVLAFTSDLGEDALGLALYLHLVVAQAFRRSGAKFRKVKPGKIMSAWQKNFIIINKLKAAGQTRASFTFPPNLSSEPAVLQYIVDALTEEDETDPISMTDDEFWQILQVLKTVSDCMHDAARAPIAT